MLFWWICRGGGLFAGRSLCDALVASVDAGDGSTARHKARKAHTRPILRRMTNPGKHAGVSRSRGPGVGGMPSVQDPRSPTRSAPRVLDTRGDVAGRGGGRQGSGGEAAQVELLITEEEPLSGIQLLTGFDFDLVAHEGAHEDPVGGAEIGDDPRLAALLDPGVRL